MFLLRVPIIIAHCSKNRTNEDKEQQKWKGLMDLMISILMYSSRSLPESPINVETHRVQPKECNQVEEVYAYCWNKKTTTTTKLTMWKRNKNCTNYGINQSSLVKIKCFKNKFECLPWNYTITLFHKGFYYRRYTKRTIQS